MAKKRAFPHQKGWNNATGVQQEERDFNNMPKFSPTEDISLSILFTRRAEAADKRRKNPSAPAIFKGVLK